jgi:hypothetical protein
MDIDRDYWKHRTVILSYDDIYRKKDFVGMTRLLIEDSSSSFVVPSILKKFCYCEPIKLLKNIILTPSRDDKSITKFEKKKNIRRPLGKRILREKSASKVERMPMRDVKYVEFTGSPKDSPLVQYSRSICMPQVENVCFSSLPFDGDYNWSTNYSSHDSIYFNALSRCFPCCSKLTLKSCKKTKNNLEDYSYDPEEDCLDSKCRRNYLSDTIGMLRDTGRRMDIEIDESVARFMHLPAILGEDYEGSFRGPLGDWKDFSGTLYVNMMFSGNHKTGIIMSYPGFCCSSRERKDLQSGVSLTLIENSSDIDKNQFIRYNTVCGGCTRILSCDENDEDKDFCG